MSDPVHQPERIRRGAHTQHPVALVGEDREEPILPFEEEEPAEPPAE